MLEVADGELDHGHIDEGLQLLDDAAVALVSSSLDALTIGMVYCELICAMQGLAQHDRAEQWTAAMDRWRRDDAFGGINGRCRVHRAEMLRGRGACEEAEEEALHACAELRPWMRREYGWPLTELGTVRLRRGDLAGAEEAFLDAPEHGWDRSRGSRSSGSRRATSPEPDRSSVRRSTGPRTCHRRSVLHARSCVAPRSSMPRSRSPSRPVTSRQHGAPRSS